MALRERKMSRAVHTQASGSQEPEKTEQLTHGRVREDDNVLADDERVAGTSLEGCAVKW